MNRTTRAPNWGSPPGAALRTDTVRIPVVDGEVATTREIPAPWLRPPVTTTYRRRDGLARRIAHSPFADDVRRAARAAFWPTVAAAGLVVGLVLIYLTRDIHITWSGVQDLTPGSAR